MSATNCTQSREVQDAHWTDGFQKCLGQARLSIHQPLQNQSTQQDRRNVICS